HLAAVALEPRVREQVLARTRGILRSNYPVIEQWLKGFGDTFSWHPPRAGAICLVRYRQAISALDLVEKMRADHSVLLVPGDHFGLPNHIRFGFGEELGYLTDCRTAAAVALTLKYLAPQDTHDALLVGAGALARLTARAMVAQLPLARLTLWNRTRERAEGLARELGQVVETRIAPA